VSAHPRIASKKVRGDFGTVRHWLNQGRVQQRSLCTANKFLSFMDERNLKNSQVKSIYYLIHKDPAQETKKDNAAALKLFENTADGLGRSTDSPCFLLGPSVGKAERAVSLNTKQHLRKLSELGGIEVSDDSSYPNPLK
jgi:hypothetical protein